MNILDTLKQIKAALPNDIYRQVFDALEQTGIRTIENDNLFDRAIDELRYAAQDLERELDDAQAKTGQYLACVLG